MCPMILHRTTPLAMTMMHHGRNTMAIIIRGTLAQQEWCVRELACNPV